MRSTQSKAAPMGASNSTTNSSNTASSSAAQQTSQTGNKRLSPKTSAVKQQTTATASSQQQSTSASPRTNNASQGSMPLPHKISLLPPLSATDVAKNKKTLVLDLDETLVHSSFKPVPGADFVISIELEGVTHRVYVRKRPGVDAFLKAVGEKWEVVIFTASLSKYADPLLDILDKNKVITSRLFREHCVQHHGNYVKDMTQLGRKIENVVIVDNSPFSYMFQPENAIACTSWFSDKADRQLYELLPFLDSLRASDDVVECMAQRQMQYTTGHPLHGGPQHGAAIPSSPGLTTGLIAQYGNPDGDD